MKILRKILRFFKKFLKWFRNFRENLGKKWENFGNLHLYGVRRAGEIIKKLVEKSMETCNILKIFMNKMSLVGSW